MKPSTSDRLSRAVFVISLMFMAVVYGTVSSWWGWFPAPQIGLAHRTYLDISRNWRNDFGLEPTRHLVAPNDSGTTPSERGYVRGPGAERQPGYVLVSGLSDDPEAYFHLVRLYDAEGSEVHRWPVNYENFDPDTPPQNAMLHGMEVFEDGSLIVTFDTGDAIARIDACGETMWSRRGSFHHSITRDGSDGIWTWEDETMVRLNAETGEPTASLDLRTDVIAANDGAQRAVFDIRTREPSHPQGKLDYLDDPFHPNDVEVLRPELAAAFPMFEAGDLMFSLRELNLVAVIDPETGLLKWWRHGPWLKQHDPDFEPDGTITVFDNATGTGQSRILRIDPADDQVSIEFTGTEKQPFYTWRRGKHQVLPNGNILMTEAEHGRIWEVDGAGEIVWTLDLQWDETSNLIATEARHVPETFFADGVPACPRIASTQ